MKRIALAIALAATPALALADIVGTYLAGEGAKKQPMTISYKDDQHIRMDMGQGSYMLVAGAKAYMVTVDRGETTVIDLDSMPKFNMPGMPAPATDKTASDVNVVKTGRRETVAGIAGDVYEITAGGKKHEAVLSTDKRALGLANAFMAMSSRLAQSLGAQSAQQIELATREARKHGYGGVLRSDQSFVLKEVADKSLPASHYALPQGSAPMEMPGMPAGFDPAAMEQMQQQMQKMMKQQR